MHILDFFINMFYRGCAVFVISQAIVKSKILHYNYNEMLSILAYKSIYIYSKIQIVYNQTQKRINPIIFLFSKSISNLLEKHNLINKVEYNSPIELYENGKLINKTEYNYKDLLENPGYIFQKFEKLIPSPYHFIVYSDFKNIKTDKRINKICYKSIPYNFEYELSNIKFIGLMLTYNNKEDELIDLYNDNYNYYVVNNRIDKYFLLYYVRNILLDKSVISVDNFQYKLTLYDEKANIKELDNNDVIVIQKDSYEIIKQNIVDNFTKKEMDSMGEDFVIT